jgi:hypothetical protein
MTLLTGFGQEEQFVDALLTELNPRRPDDIALGALPFEERTITRIQPLGTSNECDANDVLRRGSHRA